jgi:hypothetical protein
VRVSGWAAGLVLSLGLICGCSQQSAATDDLIHALSEAHSAIASSVLAIGLYDQQRITRAAFRSPVAVAYCRPGAVAAPRLFPGAVERHRATRCKPNPAQTGIRAGFAGASLISNL